MDCSEFRTVDIRAMFFWKGRKLNRSKQAEERSPKCFCKKQTEELTLLLWIPNML